MSDTLTEKRVNCRRCRYQFPVQVPALGDWLVEAQCPSCDNWDCFTEEDMRDLPRPDPQELEAETQRLGERLWQPINKHRAHPAVAWMDWVSNGVFEDDHAKHCWPIPCWVYRFTRREETAYIWQEESCWFVRGWHPMRGRRKPPDPIEVFSFKSALDHLVE